MTIEQAIEKAIEGGMPRAHVWMNQSDLLLSVTFWQALGKSLWLNDEKNSYDPNHNEWLVQWHMFIDHLADGGTIEEFFEGLG